MALFGQRLGRKLGQERLCLESMTRLDFFVNVTSIKIYVFVKTSKVYDPVFVLCNPLRICPSKPVIILMSLWLLLKILVFSMRFSFIKMQSESLLTEI